MSKEKVWHLYSRKLTGEASQDELMELQLYIEDHPSLQYEMEALEQVWMQNNQPDKEYLEATYLLHIEKMKKLGVEPKHLDDMVESEELLQLSFFKRNKRKVFAAVMVAVIVTAAIIPLVNRKNAATGSANTETAKAEPKVVVMPNGKNTSFKLPDGSTVWLNAGSKLDYSKINDAGNREVHLTGEAFFDVVKNPARPFIIHTSTIDVKVLGTKFNVKAYPEDKTVETSLVQGSVEVFVKNRPGEKYLLKPNQKLVLLNEEQTVAKSSLAANKKDINLPIIAITHLTYPKNDTLAVETSWIRNKLAFEDESFAEIAKKMERWYDVKIIFKNQELEMEELRGDFSKETLQQALDALRFASNFRYKIEGKTVIIY
ncbi:FecR family protein [Lacibacter luteus]|uniref:FecR family protein n=1 Tax=Lacibacter luteus TaxID=2508719 RepID=A0A4Q1CMH7_9BACT|nr:FecR family protein [Lacibacter luteus]RXK62268.1 FecR family protein [Lacibacter luteus]